MNIGGRGVVQVLRALPLHARSAWRGGYGFGAASAADARVVVQAAVFGPQGVLLALRPQPRGWELPGGHLAPGEEECAGLRREIREETGLEIIAPRFVGEYRRSGFWPHRARVWRARAAGGALRPSVETPRLMWCNPQAPPRTLFPWFRAPLADALAADPNAPRLHNERLGLRAVWAALAIDARMRASRDQAR